MADPKSAPSSVKDLARAEVRAEDKALGIGDLKPAEPPPIYVSFLEKVVPRLALPSMSARILEAYSSPDVTAEKLSHCLAENQYYAHAFLKFIQALGKRQETPSLESAFVLLGMQNSRNLITALQLVRTAKQAPIEYTKEGKLALTATDIVKFGIKAEEAAIASQGKLKEDYVGTAFAGGLVFDALSLIVEEVGEGDRKKTQAYLASVFEHGLKTAQVAVHLAKALPDFAYKKYIFSGALIHDAGKVALAILDPSYLAFLEESAKKGYPRGVRHFMERERFGISHAFLGGEIAHHFKVFRSIEKAEFFHHDPFILRAKSKTLYQLSAVIALATNIANNFKKPDKPDDPILGLWKGPELKDLPIDTAALIKAVARCQ